MKFRLLLWISCFPLIFLSSQSAEDLLEKAGQARESQYYQQAINLLDQGMSQYGDNYRFPFQKGELYLEQELYSLALQEFQKAEQLSPENPEIWVQLSDVLGYLDRNREAVPYLQNLMEIEDYHFDAVRNLAWVYYKLHKLKEGEELLLSELEKGFKRSFAHTLGTIYAGLYEYDLSRKYYLLSAEDAIADNDSYFAAIAYYNLSILEFKFYRFEESLRYTDLSLEQRDRASGHNSRGELFRLKLDFRKSLEEYQLADQRSENPLAARDMAQLYWEWGMLDEALALLQYLEIEEDPRWMFNFGIDRKEFQRDMSQLYRDIYRSLYRRERILPSDRPGRFWERWKSLILSYYYDSRFRKLSRDIADIQLDEKNYIHAWWIYYEGSRRIPVVSLEYLDRAREEEMAKTPEARPWYELEEGIERRDSTLLLQAYKDFDPQWEASKQAEALAQWLLLNSAEKNAQEAATLYELQEGAFLREGLKLPFSVRLLSSEDIPLHAWEGRIRRWTGQKGFLATQEGSGFELLIQWNDEMLQWYFMDPQSNVLRQGKREGIPENRRQWKAFTRQILLMIYSPSGNR